MKKKIESMTMQAQLTLVILSAIAVTFIFLIYSVYFKQSRSFSQEYTSSTETILEMEISNLDQYIRDLRSFCVQPCLNVPVYNALLKHNPLTSSEKDALKQEIQSAYHSRNDVKAYSITAIKQNLKFERNAGVDGQHIVVSPAERIEETIPYINCGQNDKYEYLAPSDSEETFFRYYHYLIRLRNREPISLSYVDVDTTQLQLLLKNHQEHQQILCLYNSFGELLYCSSPSIQKEWDTEKELLFEMNSTEELVTISGTSYLTIRKASEETGIVLISLLPTGVLTKQSRDFLFPLVMQLFFSTVCLLAIVTLLIRMITDPLKRLCSQMGRMGKGDFSKFTITSGCKETNALTVSYNDMVSHINQLIETNYISSINEKNSRLQALEAQLNPHFLYNTLQAIATEALLADHQEIYDMIVSLSSNLRYTIKGGELVPLQSELEYVDRYVLLQKNRLGDRLVVTKEIDPSVTAILIPKISIQMLVENAILHGMPENEACLHISISAEKIKNHLVVTVHDNGKGIPPEKIQELTDLFSGKTITDGNSIGLPNLASRLRILYQGNGYLSLESKGNEFTIVKMELPLPEEGE